MLFALGLAVACGISSKQLGEQRPFNLVLAFLQPLSLCPLRVSVGAPPQPSEFIEDIRVSQRCRDEWRTAYALRESTHRLQLHDTPNFPIALDQPQCRSDPTRAIRNYLNSYLPVNSIWPPGK